MGTSSKGIHSVDLGQIRRPAIYRNLVLALLLIIIVALAWAGISNVQAAASPTSPAVCLQWDISGEWQYRASLGGYGTMTFQQAGESGALTGSWHNVAGGGSGTLHGNISGASVEIHPTEFEKYTGTVAPDGTKMAGTFTYYDRVRYMGNDRLRRLPAGTTTASPEHGQYRSPLGKSYLSADFPDACNQYLCHGSSTSYSGRASRDYIFGRHTARYRDYLYRH